MKYILVKKEKYSNEGLFNVMTLEITISFEIVQNLVEIRPKSI